MRIDYACKTVNSTTKYLWVTFEENGFQTHKHIVLADGDTLLPREEIQYEADKRFIEAKADFLYRKNHETWREELKAWREANYGNEKEIYEELKKKINEMWDMKSEEQDKEEPRHVQSKGS